MGLLFFSKMFANDFSGGTWVWMLAPAGLNRLDLSLFLRVVALERWAAGTSSNCKSAKFLTTYSRACSSDEKSFDLRQMGHLTTNLCLRRKSSRQS